MERFTLDLGTGFEKAGSRRFIKDAMRVGHYKHPKNKWELDVDTKRLETWASTTKQMLANGVDIEIVVDHSDKAEDIRGYVTDAFVEPDKDGEDTLFLVHEFAEAHTDLPQTVKNVSVLIDPAFVDGEGREYGEAITHSSVTQKPVVAKQGPFIPLSLVSPNSKKQKEGSPMKELLKKLAAKLGLKEGDLTEENVFEKVSDKLDKDGASLKETETLKAQLTQATEELAKSKKKHAPEIDPDALEDLAESAVQQIEGLVASNKIVPAVAASLLTVLVGEDKTKRCSTALSRKFSSSESSIVRGVVEALKLNDVRELGTKTGMQFSLPDKGKGDNNDNLVDEATQKRMIATAS